MGSSNLGETSSVASDPRWRYDVFLSFRGETRRGFTAHLYKALQDHGITQVFIDEEELEKGRPISDLFSAIEQSRLAILVISQNYGSSTWCLRELSKILECMEARGAVLPIFYSVEPSDVGKQLGTYEQAFTKHEERFKDYKEKVERWRADLRKLSKIKGWTSKDRSEPELIKEIVEEVRCKVPSGLLEPAEKLFGIDSRLEQLDSLLDTGSNDVQFIGIWGLGGIGKTTLAKRVRQRMYTKFEHTSFLERVGEEDVHKRDDLANLKRKLSNELMKRSTRDWNMHEEDRLRQFLLQNKVLLILDDVDHINQLEKLCGDPNWFHHGSRIIITTRDEQCLISHGVKRRYELQGLNKDDALQLFCWKAFGRDYPDDNYEHLCERFVDYANGVPLALKVLGSLLHGRGEEAWHSEMGKLLKDNLNGDIMAILKRSYETLDGEQQNIFLDIACFFKGMCKDRVVDVLAGCGYHPGIDIDVLSKRCLISISENIVWMHDLLQKMGQSIVLDQSQEAGARSRLWRSEDIIHVLRDNTGTAALKGISLDFPELKGVQCHHEAFSQMFNLKFLKLHYVIPSEDLRCLPRSLRFFEWRGYSSRKLSPDFIPDELVELSMCHSSIEQLWNGIKNFDRLKAMELCHSKSLIRTPDFTEIQNLERLDLEGCESLVEIHPSLGVLKKLKFLNLKDCKSVVSLPPKIEMIMLETLNLSGCSSVRKIPEFGGCMNLLSNLSLKGTGIESIPSSIEHLSSLSSLDIRDCVNLKCLPSSIGSLKAIESLDVSGCSKLAELPQSLEKLERLYNLDSSGTAIKKLPSPQKHLVSLIVRGTQGQPSDLLPCSSRLFVTSSILPPLSGLLCLRELDLRNRNLCAEAIPNDIGCLSSLVSLNLSGNDFISLPAGISELSELVNLYLSDCSKLQQLPVLSSDKDLEVAADGCTSLKEVQYPSNLRRLNNLFLNFINCSGLIYKEDLHSITLTMLQRYLEGIPYSGDRFEIVIPGSQIPRLFRCVRMGSSVSVDVARNWQNNTWKGYALCAVFEVSSGGSEHWGLSCVLEGNGNEDSPVPLLSTPIQPVGDHLWLFYVTRDISFGTGRQNNSNKLTFSFKSSGRCLVRKCGARLIYEQDVEEFKKTVARSGRNREAPSSPGERSRNKRLRIL